MRAANRLAGAVMAVATLVGCGDGDNRADAQQELVRQGLTEEVADCVLDRLEPELDMSRLGTAAEQTAEEAALVQQAALECMADGG